MSAFNNIYATTYQDVPLDIRYDYEPPQKQSYTDPALEAVVEIYEVTVDGAHDFDILHLLSQSVIDDLEGEIKEYRANGY